MSEPHTNQELHNLQLTMSEPQACPHLSPSSILLQPVVVSSAAFFEVPTRRRPLSVLLPTHSVALP
jgi:hypothetical protein